MSGSINTANNHRLVIAGGEDELTIRVQSMTGHNRAVAKLDADQAALLRDEITAWLHG